MTNKDWDKNIDNENISNNREIKKDWDKKQSDSDQEAVEGLGDMLEKNTPPC